MAGLWCVNIGYGRTELAEVASQQMQKLSYYPHTAMNAPAAALAEKVNGLLGGDNHVYLVSSGSEANEAAIVAASTPSTNPRPARYIHQPLHGITARRWPRWPRAAWAIGR
jgi:adenosylmethionine-8-amino-7-oxononanoate aminotransferase